MLERDEFTSQKLSKCKSCCRTRVRLKFVIKIQKLTGLRVVRGQTLFFQQFWANFLQISLWFVVAQLLVDPLNHFFVWFSLPNSITSHQDKVQIFWHIVFKNIRIGSDWVFLRGQRFLFVLQVAQRSCQIEIPVNTTFCNCWTRFVDPVDLNLIFWFMVKWQWLAFTTMSHYTTTIACISYKHFL